MLAPGWSPGTIRCHMMVMLQGLPTWLSKYWIKIGNFWLRDIWDLKITTQMRYNEVLKLREISNFQNYHWVSTTPRLYWETIVDVWGRERRSWRWLHLNRAGSSACLLLVLLLPGFSVTQSHLSPSWSGGRERLLQSWRFIMRTTLSMYFILFLKLAVWPSMALNPKSSDPGAVITGLCCYVPHVWL